MSTVMVTQPVYWPATWWLARALRSDVVVLLDSAQFARKHRGPGGSGSTWQNCCEIRSPVGVQRLTVPVAESRSEIRSTPVSNGDWAQRHADGFRHNYSKAPRWDQISGDLMFVTGRSWDTLGDLTLSTTGCALGWAAYRGDVVTASDLGCEDLAGSDWMVALARAVKATRYLVGATALANYLDRSVFARAGVELVAHRYEPRPYPQRFEGEFRPNLSSVDLFANVDLDAARTLLA